MYTHFRHSRSFPSRLAAVSVLLSVAAVSHARVLPTEVVKMCGRDHGLCVLIGCGGEKSPALAAGLASSGKMLVHGIALDDACLDRAQGGVGGRR